MIAYWAAYATVAFSAMNLLTQLAYLPFFISRTNIAKTNVADRLAIFTKQAASLEKTLLSHTLSKRSIGVTCLPGRPGPKGTPGEDGLPGKDGEDGLRGRDARDILAEKEEECIVCPTGAMGPEGIPGPQGRQGEKGTKGTAGTANIDGRDGQVGPEGEVGPKGAAGRKGPPGPNGRHAHGGTGPPGPPGVPGPVGPAGAQGTRGKKNYVYGPPGSAGKRGPNGMDGMPGSLGARGIKGDRGEPGSDVKFCPCPQELIMFRRPSQNAQTRGLDPTTQPPTITTTNILSTASKVMKPNDWNGKEFRLAPRINPNPEYNFVHPTLHPNVFVLPSSEEVVDLGNMFDHSDALQTTTQASREPRPTLASSVSAASKMTEASTTLMKESETRKVETTTVTREEEATTEWEEETTPRRRFRYVTKKPRVHS